MEYKKLLVLGASGQTGRKIVDHAIRDGYSVHALVREKKNLPKKLKKAEVVVGYVLKKSDLKSALDECDAVIMALGRPQKWNSLVVGSSAPFHLPDIQSENRFVCDLA